MSKYIGKKVNITLFYDEVPREIEFDTNFEGTLEDLIADSRKRCENEQRFDDYFRTMTISAAPFTMVDVENGKGYIDISWHFSENDYTTMMNVTYIVDRED